MKTTYLLMVTVAIGSMCGCTQPDRPPLIARTEFKPVFVAEEQPGNVTPLRTSGDDELPNENRIVIDHSPSPELARAVRRGEARPAGPITDERYRRWHATADLRVRLEVQLGQQSHLREMLKMSEASEESFFHRFRSDDELPNENRIVIDHSPSPELARAVRRGEARPAGPITDERYRRWHATADLRVRLEVQLGQQSHLREMLKMSEASEESFFHRF